jgi:hypothetical protein
MYVIMTNKLFKVRARMQMINVYLELNISSDAALFVRCFLRKKQLTIMFTVLTRVPVLNIMQFD